MPLPTKARTAPGTRAIARGMLAGLGLLALLAPAPAPAGEGELERLIRKDGTTVVGVVIGFTEGAYRVRVADGVIEVPARDVRTIEPTGDRAPSAFPAAAASTSWTDRVAASLGPRTGGDASEESRRLFSDALAALLRGDWDHALRGAEGVSAREPGWVDPMLVALVVRTESGHEAEALRLALRVSTEHPDDPLALEVSAEVFRRCGFPLRAAELEERVRLRSSDPGARRELARVWWPLDRERAAIHWRAAVAKDPRLDRAEFPEAELLRRARAAIALGDLLLAGQWIEETARLYPWAEEEVLAERISLAEARLRQAELAGDLPIATLAAEALERLRGGGGPELPARLARVREQGIERALRTTTAAELAAWVRENSHLIAEVEGAERTVASRLDELALAALGRGEVDGARDSLELSRGLAPREASPESARQVAGLVGRAVDELSRRREETALAILRLLHEHFADHDGLAVERLRELLSSPHPGQLSEPERRAIAGRLAALYGDAGAELRPIAVPNAPPRPAQASAPPGSADDLEAAVAAISRWFPLDVGTRWTYRLGDGVVEEREVISSGPDGQGGWLVVLRVSPQGRVAYDTRAWIREGALSLGAPTAPPGEILLRGALAPGDSWLWRRDAFTYLREVESAAWPVETPAGVFSDVRVVRAANSLDSGEAGRSWSAEHRIIFAAGVGVVRIQGATAGVDRELLAFQPGGGAVLRPAAAAIDGTASSPPREE